MHLGRVSASDGKNPPVSAYITINVVNVDEPGRVILNTDQPEVDKVLTASILDPDGDASGASWTWARSADQTAWETIAGATGASYTPSEADVGQYLRVTASYTDPQGPGKTAGATTANPVAQPQGEPQSQDITIWSSTLTVDAHAQRYGCSDVSIANLANCSSALTDDTFTFQGTEYQVTRFYIFGTESLNVRLNKHVPGGLSSATLHVGSNSYALADNVHLDPANLEWRNHSLTWTDGQTVSAKLMLPQTVESGPTPQTVPSGTGR